MPDGEGPTSGGSSRCPRSSHPRGSVPAASLTVTRKCQFHGTELLPGDLKANGQLRVGPGASLGTQRCGDHASWAALGSFSERRLVLLLRRKDTRSWWGGISEEQMGSCVPETLTRGGAGVWLRGQDTWWGVVLHRGDPWEPLKLMLGCPTHTDGVRVSGLFQGGISGLGWQEPGGKEAEAELRMPWEVVVGLLIPGDLFNGERRSRLRS